MNYKYEIRKAFGFFSIFDTETNCIASNHKTKEDCEHALNHHLQLEAKRDALWTYHTFG